MPRGFVATPLFRRQLADYLDEYAALGATRFVEVHVVVAADMHVDASHAVADRLTAALRGRFPGAHVTIHVEPCDGSCREHCLAGCLLDAGRRAAQRASG